MKCWALILILGLAGCAGGKDSIVKYKDYVRPAADYKYKLDGKRYQNAETSIVTYNNIYFCRDFDPAKSNNIAAIYYRFFPENIVQEVVIRSSDSSRTTIDSLVNLTVNNPKAGNFGKYKIQNGRDILLEIVRSKYGSKIEKGIFEGAEYFLLTTDHTKRDDYLNLVANNPKVAEKESGLLLGLFAAVDVLDYSIPAIKKKYQKIIPNGFVVYKPEF